MGKRPTGDSSYREFEPSSILLECSTCLMLEYCAQRLKDLDPNEHVDYYDPCYDLDSHDEIHFHVQYRMLRKRLRRYLKA